MGAVKIGNNLVGEGYPCFMVAEVGINHNGSIEIAKQLIDAAVDAGANAVKFQKRDVRIVYKNQLDTKRAVDQSIIKNAFDRMIIEGVPYDDVFPEDSIARLRQ